MNEREIINGNKLIAEFVGDKYSDESYWIPEIICNNPPPYDSEAVLFKTDELIFHSSWDWLMPVIEKISSLDYNQHQWQFRLLIERFLENDIESIWQKVVDFIKWYNQNKVS